MELKPIGVIHSPFDEPAGAPIQPRYAQGVEGTVEVFEPFAAGLCDLAGFERIWLIYWFHKAPSARLVIRPFKDEVDRGLFATRAPCRPNPVGLSAVRLLSIESCILRVADVDILNGTPLVDIKPYVPEFDHYEVERIGWMAGAGKRTTADDRFSTGKE
jgi:tRNA-Thr(GGU) m(6)t(6)A37 methyltransferase TsaA